jgi:hypothetical protein
MSERNGVPVSESRRVAGSKSRPKSAVVSSGVDTKPLTAISEFGAKPYTEEEAKALSEIVQSFNERHGTQFTEEDRLFFQQIIQTALANPLDKFELGGGELRWIFTSSRGGLSLHINDDRIEIVLRGDVTLRQLDDYVKALDSH